MLNPKIKNYLWNGLFVIAIVVMIIPSSRAWVMRQVAFSPSINTTDNADYMENYDWQLSGLNASDMNFISVSDKVVFVNFWATWCPPCVAEMPMIQELYDDYKNKIEFVFVTNENWKTVAEFYRKNGYELPTYNSRSAVPEPFNKTNSIPASYLLAKDGRIAIDKVGAANWNSKKVRNLIDSLISEE